MRKTKIICTLGPATDNESVLRELMLAGMDVARLIKPMQSKKSGSTWLKNFVKS